MDTASLVIGIIASLLGFIPCINFFVFLPALVGLILGLVAYRKKKEEELPSGTALAGIILNALPLLVVISFLVLAAFSSDASTINEMTIK